MLTNRCLCNWQTSPPPACAKTKHQARRQTERIFLVLSHGKHTKNIRNRNRLRQFMFCITAKQCRWPVFCVGQGRTRSKLTYNVLLEERMYAHDL